MRSPWPLPSIGNTQADATVHHVLVPNSFHLLLRPRLARVDSAIILETNTKANQWSAKTVMAKGIEKSYAQRNKSANSATDVVSADSESRAGGPHHSCKGRRTMRINTRIGQWTHA